MLFYQNLPIHNRQADGYMPCPSKPFLRTPIYDSEREFERLLPIWSQVTVRATECTLIADAANKEEIDMRVQQIKKELQETDSTYDTEKLSERIAKLAGGVAVIKVCLSQPSGSRLASRPSVIGHGQWRMRALLFRLCIDMGRCNMREEVHGVLENEGASPQYCFTVTRSIAFSGIFTVWYMDVGPNVPASLST